MKKILNNTTVKKICEFSKTIYAKQIFIFLGIILTILLVTTISTTTVKLNKYYAVVVSFPKEQELKNVETKVKEIENVDLKEIDKIGLFNKQYKLIFDKEIDDAKKGAIEAKVKELEKEAKIDNPVIYNKVVENVNTMDYIIYSVSILALTIISLYLMNRVMKQK